MVPQYEVEKNMEDETEAGIDHIVTHRDWAFQNCGSLCVGPWKN